jgi:hypothetical protein
MNCARKSTVRSVWVWEIVLTISVDVLQLVISQIAALNETQKFDSDAVWDIVHATLAELKIRKKKDALLPMRHALSGTHVS